MQQVNAGLASLYDDRLMYLFYALPNQNGTAPSTSMDTAVIVAIRARLTSRNWVLPVDRMCQPEGTTASRTIRW